MPDRLDASALERELALACIERPELLESIHVPAGEWCDAEAGNTFLAVTRLHLAGDTVNVVSVQDSLTANGDTVPAWLPEGAWIDFGEGKLREFHGRAELRRTRAAARDLLALCESGQVEQVRMAASDIASLQDAASPVDTMGGLGDAVQEAARRALDPEADSGVHLGLQCLDEAVGGLLPGSMEVIAADTGVGKSSLVLARARGQAQRRIFSGIISCEDPKLIWGTRAAAMLTGISSLRMMRQAIDAGSREAEKLQRYANEAPALPIALDTQIGKPISSVLASMRRMAHAGVSSVYVDYVQAILHDDPRLPRKDQVRTIAALLKGEADRLGIVLHLVSQLSRPPKESKVREPSKHDLKESGDLENAAELISLLWLPDPNNTSCICMKLEKGKWGATKRRFVLKRDESGSVVEASDEWLTQCLAAAEGKPEPEHYGEPTRNFARPSSSYRAGGGPW